MSFLRDFTDYMKTRTDAPPDFAMHSGMAALSVALGNRVCCDGWTREIYPNIWIVLIAPSGYGKSAAPDMTVTLLRKAGLEEHLLPDSFSMEALLETLKAHPIGLFEVQEFAAFTGMLNRDYMSGTTQLLTKLYDCPPEERRVLKTGEIVIKNPCISILGASSPSWFAEAFKAKDLQGGFYARFLFCPSFESGTYVGFPPPRDDAAETGLSWHLRELSRLHGKYDFAAVRPFLNDWDKKSRQRAREDCPPEFAGMRSRAGSLVLKAAMLFRASSDPTSLVIAKRDVENAIQYVEQAQVAAEEFLSEEVAHSIDEADRIKIVDNLKRAGGRQQWATALKQSRLTAFKFKNAVQTLQESDRLWRGKGHTERGDAADFLLLGKKPSSNGHSHAPLPPAPEEEF